MTKLKNSKNLDSRQSLAVDSAYLACKPPDRMMAKRSKQPPHKQYLRHLIHDCLSEDELKQVTVLSLFKPAKPANHSIDCKADTQEDSVALQPMEIFVGSS